MEQKVKERRKSATAEKGALPAGRTLQEGLLTVLCFCPEGKEIVETVQPGLFEGDYRIFAERAIDYWREWNKPPGVHILDVLSDILDDPKQKSKGETFRRITSDMFDMSVDPSFNPKLILKRTVEFVDGQMFKNSIIRSAEIAQTDPSAAKAFMANALAHQTTQANLKKYELVRASDIIPRPIDWLWKGYLARGAQELMTGLPFSGKSQIHCSWIASMTTGADWPDGQAGPQPANVIMVVTEDSTDQIIIPRLMAARADRERVRILKSIRKDDKQQRLFLLNEDIELLHQMIEETGDVGGIFIDPLTAFMGRANANSVTDVRSHLGYPNMVAQRDNVTVATITHPPKAGTERAIDQFVGSQAFIAAARIGHLVTKEYRLDNSGQRKETGRYLLSSPGTNVHAPTPSLTYRIEVKIISLDKSSPVKARASREEVPYVEWGGIVDVTADQAVAATREPSHAAKADHFLEEFLDKSRLQRDVMREGQAHGFSKTQLEHAKVRLHVKSTKGSKTRRWYGASRREGKTAKQITIDISLLHVNSGPIHGQNVYVSALTPAMGRQRGRLRGEAPRFRGGPMLRCNMDSAAAGATSKLLKSFMDWIDAAHFYRHEAGREEPTQPPLTLALQIVSIGASFIRWLGELDAATQQQSD